MKIKIEKKRDKVVVRTTIISCSYHCICMGIAADEVKKCKEL
ncbi:hypothetical protein F4694_003972 [Bacillus niacini]|uniref:Uncharacterized protein n=1 Tax=Neobacillus niacini TaxID=86668 RepID=A0A852THY5_9BACI|nr:hypothetical protein [Neobacillus niacini]NYE07187.1 hypothetical protein [Neobacillus niacini]